MIRVLATACALAGTCAAWPGMPHPFHVSVAEAEYNPQAKCLEVALKVWPLDLEQALSLRERRHVDLDKEKDVESLVSAYLAERLTFCESSGTPVTLRWYGMDHSPKEAWLYFEVPLEGGVEGLQVEHRVFFELYDRQENTFLVKRGDATVALTFRKNAPRLVVSFANGAPSTVNAAPKPETPVAEPTFHEHVEPILQRRCLACHHEGGVGPFSLESFEDVRGRAPSIREVVQQRRMPPWFADRDVGHFQNDPSLSDMEIETVTRWIDGGTKEGDPSHASAPLAFPDDWAIGDPDVVYELDAQVVPAEGVVPYRYVRVKTDFAEDRWIEAAQIRSSSPEVVHHVLIFKSERRQTEGAGVSYTPPIDRQGLLDSIPPEQRAEILPKLTAYSVDFQKAMGGGLFGYLFAGEPAQGPVYIPEGTARLLPAGALLTFQIHYTPDGKEKESVTSFALRFAKEPPRQVADVRAVTTLAIAIPPNDKAYALSADFEMPRSATLVSLRPHMHVRGKSFRYVLRYTDGSEETLLLVPSFDFNWQLDYVLAPPRFLARGTVLHVEATYDNSTANPNNPDPTQKVYFGLQTTEEMLIGYFQCIWD